jgi:hypothetical protein
MASLVKAWSWKWAREAYESFAAANGRFGPILTLIKWIEDEGLTSSVFPAYHRGAFFLAPKPIFQEGVNVIWVTCPEGRFFTFIYFNGDDPPELITVPTHEGIEALGSLLASKFGIVRPPIAKPDPPPNNDSTELSGTSPH